MKEELDRHKAALVDFGLGRPALVENVFVASFEIVACMPKLRDLRVPRG